MSLIHQAYQEAIKALQRCVTPKGLYASGGPYGYLAVWARDAVIALLGGSLVAEEFKKVFKKSLELLQKNQSKKGQIPNCIGDFNVDRNSDVTYTTIDSSLWFIIGEFVYAKAYQDKKLLKSHKIAIDKALLWVQYQDSGEDHLPEQQPTCDWQDAFPHKYGHTLSTQALYYQVLKFLRQKKEALRVKKIVNGQDRMDIKMFSDQKGYYLPWIWKNHDGIREEGGWFDSFGNLLTIITGLADSRQTNQIMSYIEKKRVNRPYPLKAIYPPIRRNSKEWHSYFGKCAAKDPYQYLNAGIWPYLGGFYVTALIKARKFDKAQEELRNLARADRLGRKNEWEFNEWLDGKSGEPKGSAYQAWSAGAYIFAYESLKLKKVPYFG